MSGHTAAALANALDEERGMVEKLAEWLAVAMTCIAKIDPLTAPLHLDSDCMRTGEDGEDVACPACQIELAILDAYLSIPESAREAAATCAREMADA